MAGGLPAMMYAARTAGTNNIAGSAPPSDIAVTDWQTFFYLSAQLTGGIGLSVLLATLLWPAGKPKRNPLLVSLCFSWWISAFPCLCVLYYAGQIIGPPPSEQICMLSASLTMAQSILVSTSDAALITHVWLVVRGALSTKLDSDTVISLHTAVGVTLPYLLFIIVAIASLLIGIRTPQLVYRAKFYCVIDNRNLRLAVGITGTSFLGIAVVLEGWTLVLLHQNRALIRRLSRDGYGLDTPLVVRVCVFGFYVLLGLCLNAMSVVGWNSPATDLLYSTFGVGVCIVFGTQTDIWGTWRGTWQELLFRCNILRPRPTLVSFSRSVPTPRGYRDPPALPAFQWRVRPGSGTQSLSSSKGHYPTQPQSFYPRPANSLALDVSSCSSLTYANTEATG